ncbi:MAG: NADH-ubiquinone oxidoreductase-F iron-sulfur binding region domain-containing protein [Thermoplasmataceae archaeon]
MAFKRANIRQIESFYSFPTESEGTEYCSGTACFVARLNDESTFEAAMRQPTRTYCLGKCYESPASSEKDTVPKVEIKSRTAIVLDNVVKGPMTTVNEYVKSGGFMALRKALKMTPGAIVNEIDRSSLRGRGGAGFPTGKKWASVLAQPSMEKYVVVNADEGDSGAYIDRMIMEYDPFKLIESTIIAGYATGAEVGYIYIRREYPRALEVVTKAVEDSRSVGFVGPGILGSRFNFEIKVVPGMGSYVCGEETALLRSIEGKRPEVSVRPPYPTERGLFGKPTLVNNVETLANIPWIINNGADRFSELGFSRSRGTKAISLNSLFRNPGLYEVELGTTLDEVVNVIGGGLKSGTLKGVIVGGPIAGIIPPSKLGTKIGYEEMRSIGGELGHGGIVAFDHRTSIRELIAHVASFVAYESCGKCTPCRLGSKAVEEIFTERLKGKSWAEKEYDILSDTLLNTSLCGLGSGLGEFLKSATANYHEEVSACFE